MDTPIASRDTHRSTDPDGATLPDALHHALLDSRQRWRDLATLSADIVFETDENGTLVFISPDPAIGWPSALLLGQPAECLLAEPASAGAFNPFKPKTTVRRQRAWLRRPDGDAVCMSFAAAPLLHEDGRVAGARGIGQDITEQDGMDATVAAALRRGEVIDRILRRMRKEVLAPRMMQSALDAIIQALGAEGCVVVDLLADGSKLGLLHERGQGAETLLPTVTRLLETVVDDPGTTTDPEGRPVLACPSRTRFGGQAGLALWRAPGGRDWDHEERVLAASATTIVRVILEHESIQRELGRQARTDSLTGLVNRRAFFDEMTRRVERLERDEQPGTLMLVDIDGFKTLNERHGLDAGDEALCMLANLLRVTVRPGDLVARFGADDFALWLDGADDLTTAERAEALRLAGPKALARPGDPADLNTTLSIAIATRWPGHGEDVDGVTQRAEQAMMEVKQGGGGGWRVSHRPSQP